MRGRAQDTRAPESLQKSGSRISEGVIALYLKGEVCNSLHSITCDGAATSGGCHSHRERIVKVGPKG